jgi:CheY-like chemotaxis protein
MEGARIAIFEDSEEVRFLLSENLKSGGHTVVLEAGTIEGSLNAIEASQPGSLDLALVDYTFEGKEGGPIIVDKILEKLGRIAILNISSIYEIQGIPHIEKDKIQGIEEWIERL